MASGRLPGDFWPRSAAWTGPGAASSSECEGAFTHQESEEEAKVDSGEDNNDDNDGDGLDHVVAEMKRPAARKKHVPTSMKRIKRPAARKAGGDSPEAVAKKRAKRNAKDTGKTEDDDPGLGEQPVMKKPSASSAATKTKPCQPRQPRRVAPKGVVPRDGFKGCSRCRFRGCKSCRIELPGDAEENAERSDMKNERSDDA